MASVSHPPHLRAEASRAWGLRLGTIVLAIIVLAVPASGSGVPPGTPATPRLSPPSLPGASAASIPLTVPTTQPLELNLTAGAAEVCSYGVATCPAGTTTVRLTLSGAVPPSFGSGNSSAAQVLFVVDITPYTFGCSVGTDCSLFNYFHHTSNALTFFRAHAVTLAKSILDAHPGMNITFGLVDTAGTNDTFDDGDGWAYRVDAGQFGNATQLAAAANASFGSYGLNDIDDSDNLLHSAAVSAIYASLNGVGVHWTAGDRHVLVYVGASAPRALGYAEDICALWGTGLPASTCTTPACEPASNFSTLMVPSCVGWTAPGTGNSTTSLAVAARTAPPCLTAYAAVCPIDVLNVNATPTDPFSPDWYNRSLNGTTTSDVWNDTERVLDAGCALANATGGSWDGPTWFNCTGAGPGTLTFEPSNSTTNPTFATAVGEIGLGPSSSLNSTAFLAAAGAPLFRYVPAPNVTLAVPLNATASCLTPSGSFAGCDRTPTVASLSGVPSLVWNWSADPALNRLGPGDEWSASFDVRVNATPTSALPLDLCAAPTCLGVEGSVEGAQASGATYSLEGIGPAVEAPFPLLTVPVEEPRPLQVTTDVPIVRGEAPFTTTLSVTGIDGVPPYTFLWNVPPGATGVATGPTLVLTVPTTGAVVPVVTATDQLGASVSLDIPVTVFTGVETEAWATPLSAGNLTDAGLEGTVPFTVAFGAAASGGVTPYSFEWSSGDGQFAMASSTEFTYAIPGNYTATVAVRDGLGYGTEWNFTVGALEIPPPPVPLAITAGVSSLTLLNGTSPCRPGATAVFAGQATGGTPPDTVRWTFGDGATGSGTAPAHTYATPGVYAVTATVTDADGQTASTGLTLTVPTAGCPGFTGPVTGFSLLSLPGLGLIAIAVGFAAAVVLGWRAVRRRPTKRRGETQARVAGATPGSLPSSARRPPPPRGGSASR